MNLDHSGRHRAKRRFRVPLIMARAMLLGAVFSVFRSDAVGQVPIQNKRFQPQQQAFSALTAAEHPWGRFLPASWAHRQTITWTVREGKKIRSVTETKTTLESIEKDGVTLKEVSVVEMGGKRIETAPVLKRFDFFQQPIRPETLVAPGGVTKLIIDELIVPCEKRTYERTGPSGRQKTTVWYSKLIYPHVMRTEQILRAESNDPSIETPILSESTSEVVESSAFQIRKSKQGTYRLRSIRKSGAITTIIDSACSRHIPGGIRTSTMRELDRDGKEIRTVETRLINYSALLDSPRRKSLPEEISPDTLPVRPRWRRGAAELRRHAEERSNPDAKTPDPSGR